MSALVVEVRVHEDRALTDVRCREPRCRALLFRTDGVVNPAPGVPYVRHEHVCPDRRCRKAQSFRIGLPEWIARAA